MPAPPAVTELHREMTAHPAEYRRELGLAFPDGMTLAADGAGARVVVGDVTLDVSWQVGAPCTIGLLHLPSLRVSLRFSGADCAAHRAVLARMDLAMHRGGG